MSSLFFTSPPFAVRNPFFFQLLIQFVIAAKYWLKTNEGLLRILHVMQPYWVANRLSGISLRIIVKYIPTGEKGLKDVLCK